MRYLVTGGAGFIGSHIAEALLAEGHAVRVLDNLSSGHEENLDGLAVEFVRGDIRDLAAVRAAAAGVDGVFHEAALVSVPESVEKPVENHEINVTGTLNVLVAAREAGVRRLVLASSAAVYGENPELPKREDMLPEPVSPYALGKIAGEYYLRVFADLYGVETAALRYFNVYGPRQDPRSMYSGVISKFADVLAAGDTPTIFGDGGQTRDFVFVKDVVRANLLAMRSARAGKGEVFNVGTGRKTSLLELLDALSGIFGRKTEPKFAPPRAGDIRHSVADISRAGEILGYRPQTALAEGLRALVEHNRKGKQTADG
jgi:UDP-glucose 4-epimerase